jgi:TldD protein
LLRLFNDKKLSIYEEEMMISKRELADIAMEAARKAGASYADIRICTYSNQNIAARDRIIVSGGGRYGGVNLDSESSGFGIRSLVNGAWGFASSPRITKDEIMRVAKLSAEVGKASALARKEPLTLVPVEAYVDHWQTPIQKNPFKIPRNKKVDLLLTISDRLLKKENIIRVTSFMNFTHESKYFASTIGSYIEQDIFRSEVAYTAVAYKDGEVKTRTYYPAPLNTGFEYIENCGLLENIDRVAEEAIEHTMAAPCPSGKKDLILAPSHNCLLLHESVAHPTELDRVVLYEINYAGSSYLTLDKLGKFQWGSKLFNVVVDNVNPILRMSSGYDDDGVKKQRYYIAKEGVLVDYLTTRETAPFIGAKESRGCMYASSWANMPILRNANVGLEPGPPGSPTPEEMIADTRDGILIDGCGSFSIDHMRYNFQFGGDAFWEIKNGKKTRMLKDVTYQAINQEFWNSLDAVATREYWEPQGVSGCAKGQPIVNGDQSHPSSWIRVRNVNVGVARM